MTKPLIKHNPAFLTDIELQDAFVVREAELGILLDIVRENVDPPNQHVIVIGSRGMGKTMLVRRLALAVRQDKALMGKWYPIVFPEDVYTVSTEGEFWLKALECIVTQEQDEGRWHDRFIALREERDEDRLRRMTLGALEDFARERDMQLLVIIENLNMLLEEQTSADEAWNLRHTLQNNPAIMLLATATDYFNGIQNPEKANYEMFMDIPLKPLPTQSCIDLWAKITGEELDERRIRPMEILTGGSPRLLAIMASFAVGKSIAQLMDDLVVLIDDHTTYFKANVEQLPPRERRVFVTLAELWEPSETREVALRCRMDVNVTSALLQKLLNKGAVQVVESKGRRKVFQITERLYNIYHLMRLSSLESDRIRAFVRFLVPFFGEEHVANALACDACSHDGDRRKYLLDAIKELIVNSPTPAKIQMNLPADFLQLPEANDYISSLAISKEDIDIKWHVLAEYSQKAPLGLPQQDIQNMHNIIEHLLINDTRTGAKLVLHFLKSLLFIIENKHGMAQKEFKKAIENGVELASEIGELIAMFFKGLSFSLENKHSEAIELFENFVQRFGKNDDLGISRSVAAALFIIGESANSKGMSEKAIDAYLQLSERFGVNDDPIISGLVAISLVRAGIILGNTERHAEALDMFNEVINRFGENTAPVFVEQVALALENKGFALAFLGRHKEELEVYDRIVLEFTKFPVLVARTLNNKAFRLANLQRWNESLGIYRELYTSFKEHSDPEIVEQVANALLNTGIALRELSQPEKAMEIFREFIERFGASSDSVILEMVAKARLSLGLLLDALEKNKEALSILDELIFAFDADTQPGIAEVVRTSLIYKGAILGRCGRRSEMLEHFENVVSQYIDHHEEIFVKRALDALNCVAWDVYEQGDIQNLGIALSRIERAIEISPDDLFNHYIYACVLMLGERWEDAFEQARIFSGDENFINDCMNDVMEFYIEAAAAGKAKEALAAIEGTEAEKAMEPLVVALKMIAGTPCRPPQEVEEVAKDVVKRIEERAQQRKEDGQA